MGPTPPPRLLVVDDDARFAHLVAAIAREAFPVAGSLVVEVADTPEAAHEALGGAEARGERALVVISDHHLPPSLITGLDVLATARRRVPTALCALMTGRSPAELGAALEGAALDAFIEKPFSFDEMHALIEGFVAEAARRAASGTRVAVQAPPDSPGAQARHGGR